MLILLTQAEIQGTGIPIFQYTATQPQYIKPKPVEINKKRLNITQTHYISTESAISALKPLYPDSIFSTHENHLLFSSTLDTEKKINDTLQKIDSPPQRYQFNFKIIETSTNTLKEQSTLFSNAGNGLFISYDFQANAIIPVNLLQGTLQSLIQKNNAKLLAEPNLMTINRKKASLHIGDQVPYVTKESDGLVKTNTIQQLDTGIQITITPKYCEENTIVADISIKISSVKLWKKIGSGEYPIISERALETTLILKLEESIIIAGLFQENTKKSESGIPLFQKIPILKTLFGSSNQEKTTSDIIISITPKII